MIKRRYAVLDLYKIISAFLIAFLHYQQQTGCIYDRINFTGGKIEAYHCVELFFLISGFCMGGNTEKNELPQFGPFMKRKLLRIFPMAAIMTFVTLVVEIYYTYVFGNWSGNLLGIWMIFSSFWLMHAGGWVADVDIAVNNVVWYLSVLILCWILWWCLKFIADKLKVSPYYLMLGVALFSGGAYTYGINFPFFSCLSERGYSMFFLGIILWKIHKFALENRKVNCYILVHSFICVAMCVLGFIFDYYRTWDNQRSILCYILFPSLILIGTLFEAMHNFKRIYTVSEFCGNLAFEIFLWHEAFILLLLIRCYKNGICAAELSSKYLLMFACVIFLFGVVMYIFVEKKINLYFDKNRII